LNFLLFNNTTKDFKNPSFSEKYLTKKRKALQQNAKGLEMSGSP